LYKIYRFKTLSTGVRGAPRYSTCIYYTIFRKESREIYENYDKNSRFI